MPSTRPRPAASAPARSASQKRSVSRPKPSSRAKAVEAKISYAVSFSPGIPPTGKSYQYCARRMVNKKLDKKGVLKEEWTYLVSRSDGARHVVQWSLTPAQFAPFWSRQIYEGGAITTIN